MNQLTKEIKSCQDEIQEVCSFVEKHYNLALQSSIQTWKPVIELIGTF